MAPLPQDQDTTRERPHDCDPDHERAKDRNARPEHPDESNDECKTRNACHWNTTGVRSAVRRLFAVDRRGCGATTMAHEKGGESTRQDRPQHEPRETDWHG